MSDNAMIAVVGMVQAVMLAAIGALVAWIQWKTKGSVEAAGKMAGRHAQRAAGRTKRVAVEVKQVAVDAAKTADKVEEVKTTLHEDRIHDDKRMDLASSRAEEIANILVEGKKVTNDKLDALAVVADVTHGLVNSGYAKQLEMVAELSRWKATQTKDPVHVRAAEDAERALAEHLAKQNIVDAKITLQKPNGSSK